jgi:hypothetical protein
MDGERGVQQFVHGENSFPFGFQSDAVLFDIMQKLLFGAMY